MDRRGLVIDPRTMSATRWLFGVVAILMIVAMTAGGVTRRAQADNADPPAAEQGKPVREQFTFRDDKGVSRTVDGKLMVAAQDGGLLIVGQDGRLWTIEPAQLDSRTVSDEPFEPLSPEALGRQIARELGPDCEVVVTRHYVICTRAGKPYAQWCGMLFERLYTAFQNYWKQRGLRLHEPEFPLVALVFAHERQFGEFATKDAGPDVASAKGYFSIGTNRIALYDLTATGQEPARTSADISRRLAASPFNIATVIHEATHQIAFNSGMHERYADNPLWLTEGMAMYFESPDLTSRSGWKTVGAVNDLRLRQFQKYLERRPADSLATLVQSDARLTNDQQSGEAYAEAWALSYFLVKTRKEEYVKYLERLAAKPRLVWDKPEERLREFRDAFGEDLKKLDTEFVRFLKRVK